MTVTDEDLKLLVHSSTCKVAKCERYGCDKMRHLIIHFEECKVRGEDYLRICEIMKHHAIECRTICCSVKHCTSVKAKLFHQICDEHLILRENARKLENALRRQTDQMILSMNMALALIEDNKFLFQETERLTKKAKTT